MSLGSFYRGTTHDQDGRFKNKEKKMMENLKSDSKESDEKNMIFYYTNEFNS